MQEKKNYRKLKGILVVLLILVTICVAYVEAMNRNSKNMTGRQKILKAIYPLVMWATGSKNKNKQVLVNENGTYI